MSTSKGGMSSKVLNMKFMKQAEIREEEKEKEKNETKLKDMSEWKSSSAEKLKLRALQTPKFISAGYQSINALRSNGSPIVGRRTFGEVPVTATKTAKEEEVEDESELDKIWKLERNGKNNIKSKRSIDEAPKKGNKKQKSQP